MDDDYQLLNEYPDYIQAELAREQLLSQGIEAVVLDDQFHTMLPVFAAATGGIQVLVPSRLYQRALTVLRASAKGHRPDGQQPQGNHRGGRDPVWARMVRMWRRLSGAGPHPPRSGTMPGV